MKKKPKKDHGNGGLDQESLRECSSDEETTSSFEEGTFRKGKGQNRIPTSLMEIGTSLKHSKRLSAIHHGRPDEFRSERAKISWVCHS